MNEKTNIEEWTEELTGIPILWGGDPVQRIVSISSVIAAVLGCACAIYLCLKASSSLADVPWIPRRIGEWADHHGRFRNLPAFFLLMCPFLVLFPSFLWRVSALVAVGVFGTILELAQHFVPGRWVEWQDVFWTWVGAIVAWMLFEAVVWLLGRKGVGIPWHQRS